MKGYIFVNRYCKGIQAGIQGAHAILRLARKNGEEFQKWLDSHETIVILSAASHDHLEAIKARLEEIGGIEDIQTFTEEGLRDSLTALSFIGDEQLISVQTEMYEWRQLRKVGEGLKRREFDSDMYFKYGQTYELALYLQGFSKHDG
ncbi:hydrolase [Vibrio phage F86]